MVLSKCMQELPIYTKWRTKCKFWRVFWWIYFHSIQSQILLYTQECGPWKVMFADKWHKAIRKIKKTRSKQVCLFSTFLHNLNIGVKCYRWKRRRRRLFKYYMELFWNKFISKRCFPLIPTSLCRYLSLPSTP